MFAIPASFWLSLYFISFFFIWGVFLPFWGIWLSGKGMSSESIGLFFSVGLLLRFVSNLTLLPMVSSAKSTLRLLRILGFFTVLAFALLLFFNGYMWLAGITLVANFMMGPLAPLGDLIGARLVNQIQLDYGRVRLWGSLSFIVGSTSVGWLIVGLGNDAILWSIMGAALIMWLLSLLNLSPQLHDQIDLNLDEKKSLFTLFKRPSVLFFLIIVGSIQGSHGAFYAFGTIHWNAIGLSGVSIAWLWAIGVFAEILLMRFNKKLFINWSIKQMLLLGLIAAIIRWLVFSVSDDFYVLAIFQTFHALTFAVTHLAAIRYISLQKNAEMVSYQSLYSAVALGLMMAGFTYLSGLFYEELHGYIFLIMSLLLMPVFWCIKRWKAE
ncbi:transporter major facilitator superfamily MFS_1 [Psychromonas ingrahamii 37]|uniref:Transporter major facilitator superfamily MFS_1 n=1 Tax=Psychromonas ingrahamii (strain DSM 17664 / CCUG 51855 / 37) TaxID=357804 RepID=A1ST68_PSYIN|nr:3-phenylpropionate MFS transporter [Psychromonas ingrahamii]ABM02683.1 transporter major facilitator superfamily MFS_1 [Psychromonas ingrahamii 37]